MTKIEAQVIADSVNTLGKRLTTWVLTYPRFIHSEFMTHRVFSRNSASSRAIPVQKMIDDILADPVIPISWGKNQKGMQADVDLTGAEQLECMKLWLEARDTAVTRVRMLMQIGLHKQIANRLLEPWMHITVAATASDTDNFFAQRCHPAAEPHMQRLAYAMRDALIASTPKHLQHGEWHSPFSDDIKVSTARCARVSYNRHFGAFTIAEDHQKCDDLARDQHWSPFEHQAMSNAQALPHESRNFAAGWIQHRAMWPKG